RAEPRPALLPRCEQLAAARAQLAFEPGDEVERLRAQDLPRARSVGTGDCKLGGHRLHLLSRVTAPETKVQSLLSIICINFVYASAAAGVRRGGAAGLRDAGGRRAVRYAAGSDGAAERAREDGRGAAARPPARRRAA